MPTMDALSDRYRTYAFDFWGFGDTDRNAQHYDIWGYVEQLEHFMDQLGVMRAALVGHSMGAAAAVLFAARNADRVERVMAVSTPIVGSVVAKRLTSTGGSSLLDRVLGRRAVSDYPEVEAEAAKTDPSAVLSSARSMDGMDLWGDFENLDLPLLLVSGNKDSFIQPLAPDEVNGLDNNVRAIGLNDSGHFPMLDEASKFQRLLRDYLETKPTDLGALALKEEWRRRLH
jgi:pimeloyl-ACP methyl ester carboxylesterase